MHKQIISILFLNKTLAGQTNIIPNAKITLVITSA